MDFILAIKWDYLVAIIVGNVSLFSFDPYLVVSNKMKNYEKVVAWIEKGKRIGKGNLSHPYHLGENGLPIGGAFFIGIISIFKFSFLGEGLLMRGATVSTTFLTSSDNLATAPTILLMLSASKFFSLAAFDDTLLVTYSKSTDSLSWLSIVQVKKVPSN